ncbi:P-loop containing nucleoside triphosphate hydrolase protein [Pilobolus umbonatus]|nr:P-loop containing nucleoside triphosphate hydrolase protein [Pilobolus umbonatus]
MTNKRKIESLSKKKSTAIIKKQKKNHELGCETENVDAHINQGGSDSDFVDNDSLVIELLFKPKSSAAIKKQKKSHVLKASDSDFQDDDFFDKMKGKGKGKEKMKQKEVLSHTTKTTRNLNTSTHTSSPESHAKKVASSSTDGSTSMPTTPSESTSSSKSKAKSFFNVNRNPMPINPKGASTPDTYCFLKRPNEISKTFKHLPNVNKNPLPVQDGNVSLFKRSHVFKQLPNANRLPSNVNVMEKLKAPFKVRTMLNTDRTTWSPPTKTLGLTKRAIPNKRPLYDPSAENALILWNPEIDNVDKETELVAAVVKKKIEISISEILGLKKEEKKMAPPAEGVTFLYRCTTGLTNPSANGCIIADEMALIWTLLRQSPVAGKPTISKALIACPSSLVKAWATEFHKWLGDTKINPLIIDFKNSKDKIKIVKQWGAQQASATNQVLIISYESLRIYRKYLANAPIGLLLCDEGYRLKNESSLLYKELNALNVERRVVITGTPIQNDLSEYYSLFNFANPGLLGTPAEFRKNYEVPILRSRDADSTDKEKEIGDQKVKEFCEIANKFTLRRTNDLLQKYLPKKYEHVVFCKPSKLQTDLYNTYLASSEAKKILSGQGNEPLKAITLLKKLCNHPMLLNLPIDVHGSNSVLPPEYSSSGIVDPRHSGKFDVLARMLSKIKNDTNDKIVLISNYTQTLDILETYCKQKRYAFLRLDGSTNPQKRQRTIEQFNDPQGKEFILLLSSKAGGCGLNLIGANRLVLFDPDWNPASDQQALARIWRDGQKKIYYIYRLITSGTIEEKIFQRQSHKQSLSNCVVDESSETERHFSLADMRQLFILHSKSACETHDTFKCKRCIKGKQFTSSKTMNYSDTST